MKKLVLILLLVSIVSGLNGCRCVAQGVNGLGQDLQAWTQPYVVDQEAKHRQMVAQEK